MKQGHRETEEAAEEDDKFSFSIFKPQNFFGFLFFLEVEIQNDKEILMKIFVEFGYTLLALLENKVTPKAVKHIAATPKIIVGEDIPASGSVVTGVGVAVADGVEVGICAKTGAVETR